MEFIPGLCFFYFIKALNFTMNRMKCLYLIAFAICASVLGFNCAVAGELADEDGSRLWLRGDKYNGAEVLFRGSMTPSIEIALSELRGGWRGGPVRLELKKGGGKESFRIFSDKNGIKITSAGDAGCCMVPIICCVCRIQELTCRISM